MKTKLKSKKVRLHNIFLPTAEQLVKENFKEKVDWKQVYQGYYKDVERACKRKEYLNWNREAK